MRLINRDTALLESDEELRVAERLVRESRPARSTMEAPPNTISELKRLLGKEKPKTSTASD